VLDVSTAPRLREQFIDVVDAGHTHVIADLSAVRFMDSTGLGVLVGGLKRVLARDGALRLAGAGRDVLRLLRITGLDRVLPVYPSIEQAEQTAHAR
jgi:anti-sigma B factor antagonist